MSNVWERVAVLLAEAGCDLAVGVPADESGLLDAGADGLRPVIVRDQRVGACLASGHALVSGRPAALALTSGPAFPNALAGLAEAASLCVPLVVVTTRIPVEGLGRGGFQETDQRAMASSLAKWHHLVESPAQLAWAVRRAAQVAVNGRPGLAVVEIADEVARGQVGNVPPRTAVSRLRAAPDPAAVRQAASVLQAAERPLMILGGGAKAAGAGDLALRLAETLGAPVMVTASGRGVVPESHPCVVGLTGLYTTPPLENLLAETDVVLAVGTRLEETVRLGWPTLEDVRLVHVDCDPYAFGQAIDPETAILGDAVFTLEHLLEALGNSGPGPERAQWRSRRAELDARAWALRHGTSGPASLARDVIVEAGEAFGEHATYVHENGLHDIWSYHYPLLPIGPGSAVVMPGEQTLLGFGLPAAIGAALARPQLPTVVFCGDGALTMNITALATAAEYGVGLIIVMFDNAGFGWPRHLRETAGERADITRFRVPFPLGAVVTSLGGTIAEVTDGRQARTAFDAARATSARGATALVRVPVPDDDIPPGIARVLGESHGA